MWVPVGDYRTSAKVTEESTSALQVTDVAMTAKQRLLMCNVSHCSSVEVQMVLWFLVKYNKRKMIISLTEQK